MSPPSLAPRHSEILLYLSLHLASSLAVLPNLKCKVDLALSRWLLRVFVVSKEGLSARKTLTGVPAGCHVVGTER